MNKEVITYMSYEGRHNLSWKDLKDFIDKMPEDRLDDNIEVFSPNMSVSNFISHARIKTTQDSSVPTTYVLQVDE